MSNNSNMNDYIIMNVYSESDDEFDIENLNSCDYHIKTTQAQY